MTRSEQAEKPASAPKAPALPDPGLDAIAAAAWDAWSRQGEGAHTDALGRAWRFSIEGEGSKALSLACGDARGSVGQAALGVASGEPLAQAVASVSEAASQLKSKDKSDQSVRDKSGQHDDVR